MTEEATSTDSVELVRLQIDRFNRGDLDAYYEALSPDLVYHTRTDEPEATVLYGLEALKGLVANWMEMFEDLRVDPSEVVEAREWIILVARFCGKGRGSGLEVDEPYVFCWRLEDGKFAECREYRELDEALRELGVEVERTHAI